MNLHEVCQGRRSQQRSVAGENDQIALVIDWLLSERAEADRHRVSRATLLSLKRELDTHPVRRTSLNRSPNRLGLVADDDNDPVHIKLGQRIDHVKDQWSTTDPMEWLGQCRSHPGSLPGSKDDGAQLGGHGSISSSRGAV